MSGTLYITATPIGNLEDITLRALRTLREADFIACEDTRNSLKLLNHFDIRKPLVSCHKFSAGKDILAILDRISGGERCALVTDAGTPCISDPGSLLVRLALERGIPVETVPGPCAFIAALTLSGFDADRFEFAGFPPRKEGERKRFFARLARNAHATGFYEAPGRVLKALEQLEEAAPERQISFSRELTKLHSETVRGTARELLEAYAGREIKGEAVIIVQGRPEPAEPEVDTGRARELLQALLQAGTPRKEALRQCVLETGVSRNEAYRLLLEIK
ncbi:MAG: 16S rRNA (cytidine(1402)-2'-O)-methyltransferase [Abditibacteriota bacterium]|nr:16S rRNA (cytidine(1402)-2'-O)-methyltransferase [Abditibacteriota bacterium]